MWYSVSVLFEGVHEDGPPEQNLWEESILLFEADDHDAAAAEARQFASSAEFSTETVSGGSVNWEFREVAGIYELPDARVAYGVEIFSRFLRATEAASLLKPFDN